MPIEIFNKLWEWWNSSQSTMYKIKYSDATWYDLDWRELAVATYAIERRENSDPTTQKLILATTTFKRAIPYEDWTREECAEYIVTEFLLNNSKIL